MKIAIFHNFLDNIGGAEIVALTLAKELKADIYTTNIDLEKIKKMGFRDVKINSIGAVPKDGPSRYKSVLKLFRELNLGNKYDRYIISGEWAISGAINNKPNLLYASHLIKEAWDHYKKVRRLHPFGIWRFKFDIWAAYYRFLTRRYFRHINKVVSNSYNIKSKIKNALDRDSVVIYPPTNVNEFRFMKNGDFWLSVNRILDQKRIDIQMKAFAELPSESLVVVGSHEKSRPILDHKEYLEKIKPGNVKIIEDVDRKKLLDLYSNCRGFVTTAKDEDFGLTAVEAMASGKPVIAPNEGGYKETIVNGKTGILIDNINPEKLVGAIKIIGEKRKKYKEACISQAEKFDTKIFIKKIKTEL